MSVSARVRGSSRLLAAAMAFMSMGVLDDILYHAEIRAGTVVEPQILWRQGFDEVTPGLPTGWGMGSGGSCPEDFALEADANVPGGKCMRISSPVLVKRYGAGAAQETPVMWSSLMRADKDGVEGTLYTSTGERIVRLTSQWKRYHVISLYRGARWSPFWFGWKGPEKGTIYAAAGQVEIVPLTEAERATSWERTYTSDYEIDREVAHEGKRSIRCGPGGGASQAVEFEKAIEFTAPLALRGWCKVGKARVGSKAEQAAPHITLEVYGPERQWTKEMEAPFRRVRSARYRQRLINEAKEKLKGPDRTVTVSFDTGNHDWQRMEAKIDARQPLKQGKQEFPPVGPVRKIRVLAQASGTGAAVWFDDLSVTTAEVRDEFEEVVEEAGENLLQNPGFEETVVLMAQTADSRPTRYEPPGVWRYSETLPPPPEATCAVIKQEPTLDGKLDDACWAQATRLRRFAAIEDAKQAKPEVKARICRDASSLYVAFECQGLGMKDAREGGLLCQASDEDRAPVGPVVGVLLKPELLHPGRQFFDFAVGPDGEKLEGKGFEHRFGNGRKFGGGLEGGGWGFYADEWSAPWEARVAEQGEFWTAEIAIPSSSLEVNLDSDFWGMNLWAKTAEGTTFAWSPTYQVKIKGKFYARMWDHHVCRTKGTNYYYGRLLGMKGMVAPQPYPGLLRLRHVDLGLECLPDDSVAVLVRVSQNVPLTGQAVEAEMEVTLRAPGHAKDTDYQGETLRKVFRLSRGEQVVRVTGFSSKWEEHGTYRIEVVIRPKGGDLVLAKENCSIDLVPRYNSLLASARMRVQLSYYMDEEEARVLVENRLPHAVRAAFRVQSGDQAEPVKINGDDVIPAGGKRYLGIDVSALGLGDSTLEGRFLDERGYVVAKATDRLTKVAPAAYGVKLNRVTGCLNLGGQWSIGRMGWGTKEQGFNAINARHARNDYDKAWVSGKYIGGMWFSGQKFHPSLLERIPKTMRELRDHPGLGYWYLIDEASGPFDQLYARAREADPYHPINTGGPLRYTDMRTGCIYPFGLGRVWATPWSYTLEHTAIEYDVGLGRRALEHGVPVSIWLSFIQGNNPDGRVPRPDEFCAQVYAGLVYNMRIFKYWIQKPYYQPLRDRIVQLHKELDLFQDFLAGEDAHLLHMGRQDNIHLALWRSKRGQFLVAVNCTPWSLTTKLDLAELGSPAKQLSIKVGEEQCAALAGRTLTLRLGPVQRMMAFLE